MNHKVYLAGPIYGLTFDGAQNWREEFRTRIDRRIQCYSPLRGKEYLTVHGKLEGSYDEFPLSSDRGITERDRFDCTGSDLVVCNLLGAKERVSIGTMIELGWADANRVPVVLIMEKESNIHDHPMVRQTTSWRVDNIEDALKITEIVLLANRAPDTQKWADTTAGKFVSLLSLPPTIAIPERRKGETDRRKVYIREMAGKRGENGGGHRNSARGRRKTDTTSYFTLPEGKYVSNFL